MLLFIVILALASYLLYQSNQFTSFEPFFVFFSATLFLLSSIMLTSNLSPEISVIENYSYDTINNQSVISSIEYTSTTLKDEYPLFNTSLLLLLASFSIYLYIKFMFTIYK